MVPSARHTRDEHSHDPDPMPVTSPRPRRLRQLAAAAAAPIALLAAAGMHTQTADAAVREYWVKAVNTKWDVAPNGQDVIMKRQIDIGQRTLDAVVYRAYTKGWKKPLRNSSQIGDNDGIPGPTIEARVGDTVL